MRRECRVSSASTEKGATGGPLRSRRWPRGPLKRTGGRSTDQQRLKLVPVISPALCGKNTTLTTRVGVCALNTRSMSVETVHKRFYGMIFGPLRGPISDLAFQQRRAQIIGDCRQLKTDVDSYNDAHADEPPIQLVLDFTRDVAELEVADRGSLNPTLAGLSSNEPKRRA